MEDLYAQNNLCQVLVLKMCFNQKYNTNLSSEEIIQLDLDGDPRANSELSLYEDRMARLMAVMIGVFDPDAIILGGGMSNIDRFIKIFLIYTKIYFFK